MLRWLAEMTDPSRLRVGSGVGRMCSARSMRRYLSHAYPNLGVRLASRACARPGAPGFSAMLAKPLAIRIL